MGFPQHEQWCHLHQMRVKKSHPCRHVPPVKEKPCPASKTTAFKVIGRNGYLNQSCACLFMRIVQAHRYRTITIETFGEVFAVKISVLDSVGHSSCPYSGREEIGGKNAPLFLLVEDQERALWIGSEGVYILGTAP